VGAVDLTLRLDNAKALPTCPQQPQQQKQKKRSKPRFQIDLGARPVSQNQPARTPRPQARSNRRGGRHRLGILGRLQIGTPGRLRRNPHSARLGDPERRAPCLARRSHLTPGSALGNGFVLSAARACGLPISGLSGWALTYGPSNAPRAIGRKRLSSGVEMGVEERDSTSLCIIPGAPVVTNAASFRNTRKGYAVGAGMEMRLWANLVAKVEYLHIDVAGTANSFVPPFFVGPGGSLTTTTNRIHDDLVRVGLNWKFGGVPLGFCAGAESNKLGNWQQRTDYRVKTVLRLSSTKLRSGGSGVAGFPGRTSGSDPRPRGATGSSTG
jgi:hypothetical protein